MPGFKKNVRCPLCGEKLAIMKEAVDMRCAVCGDAFYTDGLCKNKHYVCGGCQLERALEKIASGCLNINSNDALAIGYELLMSRWIAVNGPEHHFLTAAALLTAYHRRYSVDNIAGADIEDALREARSRTMKIPDGACGFWGCCGAAAAAGIFVSLVLKAMPSSGTERGAANRVTAQALARISETGEPRCCKRETFTAIFTASRFAEEQWGLPLTDYQGAECHFYHLNDDCAKERCSFYSFYHQT